jgi:hypothetical protein
MKAISHHLWAGLLLGLIYNAGAQPVITLQPQTQSGSVGGSVTFRVEADGIAPLSYQWRHNETALAGEIGTTLTLMNLRFDHAGS